VEKFTAVFVTLVQPRSLQYHACTWAHPTSWLCPLGNCRMQKCKMCFTKTSACSDYGRWRHNCYTHYSVS